MIFGASVRAAAFSALRAGLQPWCADLFADTDLQARCPVNRILFAEYPKGFAAFSAKAPPGSWIYTGGLENHPKLVEEISASRPLWGNRLKPLVIARSPAALAMILQSNRISFPMIRESPSELAPQGRWLVKPRKGAGGTGIFFHNSTRANYSNKRVYFQQFIEGFPCSAVYVGLKKATRLLGVTRQLVGEAWLNAAPFHYCGSIGPLPLEPTIQKEVDRIGNVLAQECLLRGLFGVDFILSEGKPWPVEVNPRYPASTEILEYVLGIKAMTFHRSAFESDGSEVSPVSNAPDSETARSFIGKAILFAKRSLKFPKNGPWTTSVGRHSIDKMPAFADVPEPGRVIKPGAPILTFFGQSSTIDGCLGDLRKRARALDRYLWKP